MGFGDADKEQSYKNLQHEILAELRRTFSPEFINRIDELIVFRPLGEDELRQIIDILLLEINLTLAERNLRVSLSDAAKKWLLGAAGLDPSTGARPLRRALQRHVQDPVSEILISESEGSLSEVEVDVDDDELTFKPTFREVLTEAT
jgi:ATP-dependent Clp protease ATP-binding subunit ClpC